MLPKRQLIVAAVAAALVLSLGAAPRPAEAGICKGLGSAKQCVVRRDIKKNAVKGSSVADESLTGADVKNGSLSGAEIQDGSLSGADFQDGSLSGVDILVGGVNGADIQDGSLSGADFQDGSITGADLAADAVTMDDILARILVVSPVGDGSDSALNGAELLAAIGFLGSVSPGPSAASPWTLKLEPGIYDVGSTGVTLPSFVGLEGSGQGVTEITGDVEGNIVGSPGVVTMADGTAIRQVTVTNTGGVVTSFAITAVGGPIRISDTTAQARDGSFFSIGLFTIVPCAGLAVTNVTATATAAGTSRGADLRCTASVVTNMTATGDDLGLFNTGTTTLIRDSILTGAASVDESSGSLNIANSQLNGTVTGTPACVGTYDANLTAMAC